MTTTTSFSERLSEKWLIERTYHAQLLNGKELSVPDFTETMKQLIDFAVPLSSQSGKSKLAERLPTRKSSNFYVPLSTWKEISQEEAHATAQRGIPVLLYGEHPWEHLTHGMRNEIYSSNEMTPIHCPSHLGCCNERSFHRPISK